MEDWARSKTGMGKLEVAVVEKEDSCVTQKGRWESELRVQSPASHAGLLSLPTASVMSSFPHPYHAKLLFLLCP